MVSLFIKEPPELDNLTTELKENKKERFLIVKSLTNLALDFNKGALSENEFRNSSENIISEFEVKHKKIISISTNLKKAKLKSQLFRFGTVKIFAGHLGIVISLLFSSFIIVIPLLK